MREPNEKWKDGCYWASGWNRTTYLLHFIDALPVKLSETYCTLKNFKSICFRFTAKHRKTCWADLRNNLLIKPNMSKNLTIVAGGGIEPPISWL